jgi:hypothetical protein
MQMPLGIGIEPSGRAKACPNSDAGKPAASPNDASSSAAQLAREATFPFREALKLFTVNTPHLAKA